MQAKSLTVNGFAIRSIRGLSGGHTQRVKKWRVSDTPLFELQP
jgi:hypothetical protein